MSDKDNLKNRFIFLIDFAVSEYFSKSNNPYIQEYVLLAFDISKKINYRVPKDIHFKVCKYCNCVRDSQNTKIRTITETKNKQKCKFKKIHCLNCGKIKKIRMIC